MFSAAEISSRQVSASRWHTSLSKKSNRFGPAIVGVWATCRSSLHLSTSQAGHFLQKLLLREHRFIWRSCVYQHPKLQVKSRTIANYCTNCHNTSFSKTICDLPREHLLQKPGISFRQRSIYKGFKAIGSASWIMRSWLLVGGWYILEQFWLQSVWWRGSEPVLCSSNRPR